MQRRAELKSQQKLTQKQDLRFNYTELEHTLRILDFRLYKMNENHETNKNKNYLVTRLIFS